MYTNAQNVEDYLSRELTDQELALLPSIIETVTQFINDYTGRLWVEDLEDVESTTKTFDGPGTSELFTPDFVELESVRWLNTSGGVVRTFNPETELVTYPLNKDYKNSIQRRVGTFPARPFSLEVDAKWVTGELPDDVTLSATMLVAHYLNTKSETLTGFKRESIEGYSYEILSGAEKEEKLQSALSYLGRWKKMVL